MEHESAVMIKAPLGVKRVDGSFKTQESMSISGTHKVHLYQPVFLLKMSSSCGYEPLAPMNIDS